MAVSHPGRAPLANRVLGVVGILGGLVLLAAFVVDIPEALNPARLVLFHAGAIAVAVAVHPWHERVAPRLALAGAVPLVIANAWSISWVLLSMGRERPFAGDFGLIGFYESLAVWLADAWFGLCALRIGVLWPPATFVLAAGSLLAGCDVGALAEAATPVPAATERVIRWWPRAEDPGGPRRSGLAATVNSVAVMWWCANVNFDDLSVLSVPDRSRMDPPIFSAGRSRPPGDSGPRCTTREAA